MWSSIYCLDIAMARGSINRRQATSMAMASRSGSIDPQKNFLTVLLGQGDGTFTKQPDAQIDHPGGALTSLISMAMAFPILQ